MNEGTNDARTILAIEASNPSSGAGGVCVARVRGGGAPLVEVLGHAGLDESVRASDGVMLAVERACAEAGVGARAIDAVAVSIGPGGYTALRISATTAKTLAYVIGCPVIPVPTWAVARAGLGGAERPALIALAGKGGAAHLTVIGADGSARAMGVVGADAIDADAARTLVGDAHVPGPIVTRCAELGMGRAEIVLRAEGCAAAAAGFGGVGPDELEPDYAREPDAVTQWRARHGG